MGQQVHCPDLVGSMRLSWSLSQLPDKGEAIIG